MKTKTNKQKNKIWTKIEKCHLFFLNYGGLHLPKILTHKTNMSYRLNNIVSIKIKLKIKEFYFVGR